MPSLASSEVASAVVTPSAAARPMNSRLPMRPFLISWVQYSSSLIFVSLRLRCCQDCDLFFPRTAGAARRCAPACPHLLHIVAVQNSSRTEPTQCHTDAPTARRLTGGSREIADNALGSVIRRVLHLVFLWPHPTGVPGHPC